MINFHQITDKIFIGTYPTDRIDIQHLQQAGLTAVLNLQSDTDLERPGMDWPGLKQHYRNAGLCVCRLPITDFDHEDLIQKLPAAAQTLAGLVDAGHRVYVHCTAGKQRSPGVVIGYLAWHDKFALEEALERVLTAHHCDPPASVLKTADAHVQGFKR